MAILCWAAKNSLRGTGRVHRSTQQSALFCAFSSPLDEQDRGLSCRVSCLTLHLISLLDWRLHDTPQHGTLSHLKGPSSQTRLA
jgi:hypothetical protein